MAWPNEIAAAFFGHNLSRGWVNYNIFYCALGWNQSVRINMVKLQQNYNLWTVIVDKAATKTEFQASWHFSKKYTNIYV